MNQVELCEFQTKFNANHLNGSFLNQSGSLVESHIFSYAIALMSLLINYWCLSSIVRNRLINKWQTWKMAVSSVSLPPPPPHDALLFFNFGKNGAISLHEAWIVNDFCLSSLYWHTISLLHSKPYELWTVRFNAYVVSSQLILPHSS